MKRLSNRYSGRERKVINGKDVSVDYWGRATDSQKTKVYKFSWDFRGNDKSYLSKEECQALANKALNFWHGHKNATLASGMNHHVEIVFNTQSEDDDRRLTSNANKHRIKLQTEWGMNHYVVLHEVAHVIMDRDDCCKGLASHGPEFVKIMLMLWGRFIQTKARKRILDSSGVSIASKRTEEVLGLHPSYQKFIELAKEYKVKFSGPNFHDGTSIRPVNRTCKHLTHNKVLGENLNFKCKGH